MPPASQQQFNSARLFLDAALDEADTMISWMSTTGDPTTYAEASAVGNFLMRISRQLWVGAHWSSIGAAALGNSDAEQAFELTMDAIETNTDLRRSAGRCYMGAYLP